MTEAEGCGTALPRSCFEQDLLYWMGRIHGRAWVEKQAYHVLALYRTLACCDPNDYPSSFSHMYPEPRVDRPLANVRRLVRFGKHMRFTPDDH